MQKPYKGTKKWNLTTKTNKETNQVEKMSHQRTFQPFPPKMQDAVPLQHLFCLLWLSRRGAGGDQSAAENLQQLMGLSRFREWVTGRPKQPRLVKEKMISPNGYGSKNTGYPQKNLLLKGKSSPKTSGPGGFSF